MTRSYPCSTKDPAPWRARARRSSSPCWRSPWAAANAHDDGLPAFRYSAELLGQLQLPSVALPLNDELFLYGRDAEAFDLEAYLALNAPALRDRANTWSTGAATTASTRKCC